MISEIRTMPFLDLPKPHIWSQSKTIHLAFWNETAYKEFPVIIKADIPTIKKTIQVRSKKETVVFTDAFAVCLAFTPFPACPPRPGTVPHPALRRNRAGLHSWSDDYSSTTFHSPRIGSLRISWSYLKWAALNLSTSVGIPSFIHHTPLTFPEDMPPWAYLSTFTS